jgi:hypothetical protein
MRGSVLFLFFLDFHGFQVFSFKDLSAIQTLHVVHPVSTGNHLGAGMLTNGLHKHNALMRFILTAWE